MSAARKLAYTRALPPPPVRRPPPPALDEAEAGEDTLWCRACQALTPRRLTLLGYEVRPLPLGRVRIVSAARCACGARPPEPRP